MKIEKNDIIIRKGILHILDSNSGYLGLSENLLDLGIDQLEFIRSHIYKILASDDTLKTSLSKCQSSIVKQIAELDESNDQDFIHKTKLISETMFDILCDSVHIPSADLLCISFQLESQIYLALLKMNYKEIYTHRQTEDEGNEMIKQRILPQESSKLTEAVVVNLQTKELYLVQKKYEMLNGDKINYLSEQFLMCNADLTSKKKFQVLNTTINNLLNQSPEEKLGDHIDKRIKLYETVADSGQFDIHCIGDTLFGLDAKKKQLFDEKMERYDIQYDQFKLEQDSSMKKISTIQLETDTGIQISIPVEQLTLYDNIKFVDDPGTLNRSIIIENIEQIHLK